jgi:hypothetical protein
MDQIKEYVPVAQVLSTLIAAISVGFAAFGIFRTNGIGGIWEDVLKDNLSTPLFLREWQKLRVEFKSDQEFIDYIDEVQKNAMANLKPSTLEDAAAIIEQSPSKQINERLK